MLAGRSHDAIHFAGDAGVVHHENCPGASRNPVVDQPLIDIQGVRADIDEHWRGC
jgi:hypothetical protein